MRGRGEGLLRWPHVDFHLIARDAEISVLVHHGRDRVRRGDRELHRHAAFRAARGVFCVRVRHGRACIIIWRFPPPNLRPCGRASSRDVPLTGGANARQRTQRRAMQRSQMLRALAPHHVSVIAETSPFSLVFLASEGQPIRLFAAKDTFHV